LNKSSIGYLGVFSLISFFVFSPIVYKAAGWRIAATHYPGFIIFFCGFISLFFNRILKFKSNHILKTVSQNIHNSALLRATVLTLSLIICPILYAIFAKNNSDSFSKDYSFTLYVNKDSKIRWLSLNSANTNPAIFKSWFSRITWLPNQKDFDVLTDFMNKNIQNIKAIKLENGTLFIVTNQPEMIKLLPNPELLHPWAPRFKVLLSN
jgi:hypothetical protein